MLLLLMCQPSIHPFDYRFSVSASALALGQQSVTVATFSRVSLSVSVRFAANGPWTHNPSKVLSNMRLLHHARLILISYAIDELLLFVFSYCKCSHVAADERTPSNCQVIFIWMDELLAKLVVRKCAFFECPMWQWYYTKLRTTRHWITDRGITTSTITKPSRLACWCRSSSSRPQFNSYAEEWPTEIDMAQVNNITLCAQRNPSQSRRGVVLVVLSQRQPMKVHRERRNQ